MRDRGRAERVGSAGSAVLSTAGVPSKYIPYLHTGESTQIYIDPLRSQPGLQCVWLHVRGRYLVSYAMLTVA